MGDGLNCTVNSTVWHRLRIRLHKFFVFSSQFASYFPHDFTFFSHLYSVFGVYLVKSHLISSVNYTANSTV